ncbi:hypothetical protein GmHk_U059833 (mitochondrion) [Glycine max]|nr:hypothetical protein GmHk_U059833 [Glycine max]UBY46656.1 hypothetical protein [Glycine max]
MRVMDGSDHPLIGNALPCTKIGNFGQITRVSVFTQRMPLRIEKKATNHMSSFKDYLRGISVRHKCGLYVPFDCKLTPDEGVEDSLVISDPPPIRPQSNSELCSPGVVIEKRRFKFGNHRLLIHARFAGFV